SHDDFGTGFRQPEKGAAHLQDQLEPRLHAAGAEKLTRSTMKTLIPTCAANLSAGLSTAAEPPQASLAKWIEAQGGEVVRGPDANIIEVSLARTWATDNDVERIVEIKGLKRLDLSFSYVSDRGIERLQQLQQLEELTLDTAEFITDAATN